MEEETPDNRVQDFVLRCDYEDPDYPWQFDCALRGLTAGAVNHQLH
jgi:hypothetical protein